MLEFLDLEKYRLSTPKWERVTQLLDHYKKQLNATETSPAGAALLVIYKKNKAAAIRSIPVKNSNLLSLGSKPEMLLLAYRQIKGNKGVISQASPIAKDQYNNLSPEQRVLYLKSFALPDGLSIYDIFLISKLIRKGAYPWGTSTRIYINKPGQPDKMRPLTMANFMDKVVQKSIELVLHSIYAPFKAGR
jgi:hypothetical protein